LIDIGRPFPSHAIPVSWIETILPTEAMENINALPKTMEKVFFGLQRTKLSIGDTQLVVL
jgi:hypothetical protein